MIVLFNGEYREYDVSADSQYKNIYNGLLTRKAYLGQQIGDFRVETVDYDWGTHRPINRVVCVLCGRTKDIPNLADFRRGKGVGRLCQCRYEKEEKPPRKRNSEYVGETHNGWHLLSYEVGLGFRVECVKCGKQIWSSGKSVLEGTRKCNHKISNDYSDPKYIGMKRGNLTAVERVGTKMRFRCDCGTEIVTRPSDVFREGGIVKSCGRDECPNRRASLRVGNETRKRGVAFEFECADVMREQGFEVEMLPSSGDYGVDFFATVDGEKVAFQCKKLHTDSAVHAVQEVYAGGRYYDCCKFVVVSPSGFSHPAEVMASKLGVQLETNLQNFQLKTLVENKIATQKIVSYSGRELRWEIDGVVKTATEWCREYGISRTGVVCRVKRGMDLKTALTTPTGVLVEIAGVVKRKQDWCDEYGISPPLYDYRVKYSGMSPIEALTTPKGNRHRA